MDRRILVSTYTVRDSDALVDLGLMEPAPVYEVHGWRPELRDRRIENQITAELTPGPHGLGRREKAA